jgi:alpha-tubulin suppressor-like RCC1 family protein
LVFANDTLFGFGRNLESQLGLADKVDRIIPTELDFFRNSNLLQIHCFFSHNIVILKNNSLYVFGENQYGQLGLGKLK